MADVQIPILSGCFADNGPDIRQSFPINLVPVPAESGVSAGYLRPADGITGTSTAPQSITRGGINWRGTLYRVTGTALISVAADGTVLTIGDVGAGGTVSMCYGPSSTTYPVGILAVASGGRLYYYDGSTLTQVTDIDLGVCVAVIWLDGYFISTDGESIIVSDLADPFSFSATKYGSSEASPDPITALLRTRNEMNALNRFTIEVFDNVGGTGFPFARIEGAQIQKGCIGTHACCVFLEALAFLGSGENEAPSVYLGANGSAQKLSTFEIDRQLSTYTELQLSTVVLETRNDNGHLHLYVHLPDRTLVYDHTATEALGQPVWFVLTSGIVGFAAYRGRHFVWCYDRWTVGDNTGALLGEFTQATGRVLDEKTRWEFATSIIYNKGAGLIISQLELVALTGRLDGGASVTADPLITTSSSLDGVTWSQDASIAAGKVGERLNRLIWRRQGTMRNMRMQRFRGDSDAHVSFARLEAAVEPLAW
jgi:hypothetical protein